MASFQKVEGKKGNSWRAFVMVNGKRETQTFPKLAVAKAWAADMEAKKAQGKFIMPSEAKQRTLGELIDRYVEQIVPQLKSASDRRHEILRWKQLLGNEKLYSLCPDQILKAREEIQKQLNQYGNPVSNSTVNRYSAALHHALSVAITQYQWIDSHPMKTIPKLKEPKGRDRYLDDNERERLLKACKEDSNPFIYTIVIMGITTGMRKQEMLNLKWKHILFDQSLIIVEESKNGLKRSVSITKHLKKLLEELYEENSTKSKFVFPGKNNLQPIFIKSTWQRVIKASGVRNFRFHDLRHTAASYLAMNGASVPQIATVLGHKNFQMAARYAHLSEASTKEILESTMASKFEGIEYE